MKERYENEKEEERKEKELLIIPEHILHSMEKLNENIERLLELIQNQPAEDMTMKSIEEYTKALVEKLSELVSLYSNILTVLKNIESKLDSLVVKETSGKASEELSYTSLKILEILNERKRVTDRELMKMLKLKKNELQQYLRELEDKGMVRIYEAKSFYFNKRIKKKL